MLPIVIPAGPRDRKGKGSVLQSPTVPKSLSGCPVYLPLQGSEREPQSFYSCLACSSGAHSLAFTNLCPSETLLYRVCPAHLPGSPEIEEESGSSRAQASGGCKDQGAQPGTVHSSPLAWCRIGVQGATYQHKLSGFIFNTTLKVLIILTSFEHRETEQTPLRLKIDTSKGKAGLNA